MNNIYSHMTNLSLQPNENLSVHRFSFGCRDKLVIYIYNFFHHDMNCCKKKKSIFMANEFERMVLVRVTVRYAVWCKTVPFGELLRKNGIVGSAVASL